MLLAAWGRTTDPLTFLAFSLPVLSIIGTIAMWRCSPPNSKRGPHGSSRSVRRAGFAVDHAADGGEEAAYDSGDASVPLNGLLSHEPEPEAAQPAMAEHVSSLHALLAETLRSAYDPEVALHNSGQLATSCSASEANYITEPPRVEPATSPTQDDDQPAPVVALAPPVEAEQSVRAAAEPMGAVEQPTAAMAADATPLGIVPQPKALLPARAAPLISLAALRPPAIPPALTTSLDPTRPPQQLTAAADRQIDEMLKSQSDRLLERLHIKLGLGNPRDYSVLERDGALDRAAGPNDDGEEGTLPFDDDDDDQEDDASLYLKLVKDAPATTLVVD